MNIKLMFNAAKAVLVAWIFSLLLLLVFNFISFQRADPNQLLFLFASIAVCSGAILSGFVAAKLNRKNGILCGLLAGILYVGVLFLVSLFFREDTYEMTLLTLGFYGLALICATMGGFFGVSRKSTSKPHKPNKHVYPSKKS